MAAATIRLLPRLLAPVLLVAGSAALAGPAQAAPWARIGEVGTRTVAIVWTPAGARASLGGVAPGRVEGQLASGGRWRPLDPVRAASRTLVVRTLEPSRRATIRVRACDGRTCGRWLALRTRTIGIPKGAAVPGDALGPLPTLGIADFEHAHTEAFDADATALGLGLVRVVARWGDYQPVAGPVRFTSIRARRTDEAIRRALAADRQVVITVDGPTPAFAIDPLQPGRAPRVDAWRRYVRALARRYPDVLWWEAWNEPNTTHTAALWPYRQLQLARALRVTVRERNRHARVLLALASGKRRPFGPARQLAYWSDYLRFADAYGIVLPAFDAISFHPYNRDLSRGVLPQSAGDLNLFESGDVGRLLGAIDEAFPGRRIPLAVTEFGYLTGPTPRIGPGLTPDAQAEAVCGSLSELRRWNLDGRILMAIWYQSRDEQDPERAWTSGLRYADGTAKPAFDTWRRYVTDPPATFAPTCEPAAG